MAEPAAVRPAVASTLERFARLKARNARKGDAVIVQVAARDLVRARDLADARYWEPLDVRTLARAARMSPAHFSREFKRHFGETPHQYLLTRRMERAAALLRATDRSVADICLTVGLVSVGSFTTSFGRIFGMSPQAYRGRYPLAARQARIPACVVLSWGRPSAPIVSG